MSNVRVPHETEPTSCFWTAWPDHPDWERVLGEARGEIAAFAGAAADAARAAGDGPDVVVLSPPDGASPPDELRERVTVRPAVYGDIWLRDTGPVWALEGAERVAVRFRFNGWGGKYLSPGDHDVAPALARALGARLKNVDLVAEGGAFEHDGEGTLITTRSCLLDRNRNPGCSTSDIETVLENALGAERVIWLDEGLARDHTDGHVDTLARFVRPGLVLCQAPSGPQDPNRVVLDDIARALDGAHDAGGRKLEVVRLPSAGYVPDTAGRPAPATHLNFVHVGRTIIAPVYGTPSAEDALEVMREVFEGRTVIGLPANAMVDEGGAFHCASCAAPAEGLLA